MRILGISCYYHDSAAAVIEDGRIVAAAQEERFTRKKHDPDFPRRSVAYCLTEAGCDISGIDAVAFYDKPFLKFERILETYLATAPVGVRSYLLAIPVWLKKKLWIPSVLQRELGWDGPVLFTEHHESHAASAFYPSPYEKAAVLTIDGVGEWACGSWGVGKGNALELEEELHFPHSLGLLYSAFTYYTGFKVNSGEYKLMGLAPYGEPKYRELILEKLLDLKGDGSFKLDMRYFNFAAGLTMTNRHFHHLFGGEPRKPESRLTQKEMDIAASIQSVTEQIMLRMAKHVRKKTGERYLCMAGGVALNCVANAAILREKVFDGIFIQPAAGDAGGAVGAALAAWHGYYGKPRHADGVNDSQQASLLGPAFSPEEIASLLASRKAPYEVFTEGALNAKVAALLSDGKVVGIFRGRMEFGPRALGARSIIGDARNTTMQSVMNLKIKFRESFRPFAPAVLAEHAEEYFETGGHESPYMLFTAFVTKKHRKKMTAAEEKLFGIEKLNVPRSDIPAVTHVDYSARLQTVSKEAHPRFHALISAFYKKTGCPVVVNTSFNVRGEPIVCTPEDAYRCFMRTDMDAMVMENYLLLKSEQPKLAADSDWKKEYELD
ncbi:carbamoyltransferase [Candidatus Kaiserbacteria bacterium]|nr:carbamoyltransferase [Candidatus Kaiserbacteria bacterium]